MKTVFDIVSVIIFVGIAILYLQRSASEEQDKVALWKYAVAAVGCAVSNYLGNNGYAIPAAIVTIGVVAVFIFLLKPFDRGTE